MGMDSSSSNTGGTADGSGDASAADASEVAGSTASATRESGQLTNEGKLHAVGSDGSTLSADDTHSADDTAETDDAEVPSEGTSESAAADSTDAAETEAGTDDVAEPERPTNEVKLHAIGPDSATGTDDGSDVDGADTRTGTEEADDATGESDDSAEDATADREPTSDRVQDRRGAGVMKTLGAGVGVVGAFLGSAIAQDDVKVSLVGADRTPSFTAPADAKAGATTEDRVLSVFGRAGDAMKGGARGTVPAPSDVPPEPTGFPTKQQEKGVNQGQRPRDRDGTASDDETPGR